jgi:hypothetical protein
MSEKMRQANVAIQNPLQVRADFPGAERPNGPVDPHYRHCQGDDEDRLGQRLVFLRRASAPKSKLIFGGSSYRACPLSTTKPVPTLSINSPIAPRNID